METLAYHKNISPEELQEKLIYIDKSSQVADGVKIGNNVCIVNSKIDSNCEIKNNTSIVNSTLGENTVVFSSQIEDSLIGYGCIIGPFSHIRNRSILGNNLRVGNFVEIKNSIIGDNSKMAHLSYVGDAEIGKRCNIGCGVVFCKYDGKVKQKTYLGDNVFVGSNVSLIAPLKIESGAYVAAGSTINKDIGAGEFAIARERQINKNNYKNPYLDKK